MSSPPALHRRPQHRRRPIETCFRMRNIKTRVTGRLNRIRSAYFEPAVTEERTYLIPTTIR